MHYRKERDICTIFFNFIAHCLHGRHQCFLFGHVMRLEHFMEKIQETHFPLYLTPSFIYSSINLVIVDVYKFTIIDLMIFRLKTSSLIDFEGPNNNIRQYSKSRFWGGKIVKSIIVNLEKLIRRTRFLALFILYEIMTSNTKLQTLIKIFKCIPT